MRSTSKRIAPKGTLGSVGRAARIPAIAGQHSTARRKGPRAPKGMKVTQVGIDGKDIDVEVLYVRHRGIKAFVDIVRHATPIQLVRTEREGVSGRLVKDLAAKMDISAARFYAILGVPKATLESKAAKGEVISGAGGQAALSMVRLLGQAEAILERSTSPEAKGFDVAKWLGSWIEQPQPALGGRKPADFLDTPTGFEIVSKALGALESGSYL